MTTSNASDMRRTQKRNGCSQYTPLRRYSDSPPPSVDPFPSLPSGPTTPPPLPKFPVSYSVALSCGSHTPRKTHAKALTRLYPWASEDLVADALESVEGDEKRAMEWLDSMAASVFLQDSASSTCSSNSSKVPTLSQKQASSASVCNGVLYSTELRESCAVEAPEAQADDLKGLARGAPTESEWQKDNPYIIFRKDALRAGRDACRHAKSATHAFKVGDHRRAKFLSKKAQEERSCAQALNAKAASEIFRLNNLNRDIWSLDLHGLYASEAVSALQARLSEIELQINDSFSSRLVKDSLVNQLLERTSRDAICERVNTKKKWPESLALNVSADKVLTVIIGAGTHSRGSPTLPNAVENYLDTNHYRYNKPRPGIITVTPKRWAYAR